MALTALASAAVGMMVLVAAWALLLVHRDRRRLRGLLAPLGESGSVDELVVAVGAEMARLRREASIATDARSRLEEALSAVPEGVVVCDLQGEIRYRNEVAQTFAGARHGEALADLAVTELLGVALRRGPAEKPIELYGPPRRALLIRALPLVEGGETVGAVAIIEDISERRRLEAVRRDFVANVSHELKSPVGALGILAETMQAEDEPAVSRRLAERMQLEAFRVARIIDDLLDLSRIESEEAPVREPVTVHVVVAQAVERVRPVAEHRGITIDVSEAPRRLSVVGDRRQLVSAIHNLLENAVKYSDDQSTVEVRVRSVANAASPEGTAVEIAVRDYGIGIPSRDLERIFERFYRVDRARARPPCRDQPSRRGARRIPGGRGLHVHAPSARRPWPGCADVRGGRLTMPNPRGPERDHG